MVYDVDAKAFLKKKKKKKFFLYLKNFSLF